MTLDEIAGMHDAIPPGVIARQRSSPFSPVQVPDLIGIKDRRYFDRTALQQHRSIIDLIGTDPILTTKTRRGTGYYKVPSLRGVWYRGPFEHNGSVATLEDWFEARRLRDDYVPTGFRGYRVNARAVRGHQFGLEIAPDEKRALIAFLKTL
jgi:processive rubber oxygenase RoxA-like protein